MQAQPQLPYKLFRVPETDIRETAQHPKVVIGLIDASGSMSSYWPAMVKFWNTTIAPLTTFLITFSQKAKLEETTTLSEDLSKHGGGMTNIFAAFKMMEEKLIDVPEAASITIVFISDGDDTVTGKDKLISKMQELRGGLGRDITLICLGIQSEFPTIISMKIRQLYHTGDEKIAALYLIEYASEKAFFNKFETISFCFKLQKTVSCPKNWKYFKAYPWEQGREIFRQREWLMVPDKLECIELVYGKSEKRMFEVGTIQSLSLDDLVDCFRGWVQKVQLCSMNPEEMKVTSKIAASTYEMVKGYTEMYEKMNETYILRDRKDRAKSVKQRAMDLEVKNIGVRIKWYLDELQIIAKGVGIGQLNQYQAAKRLGIGTITGKYHQKALALKGITAKDFDMIRKEFKDIFRKVKLSSKPSPQECSIFTLQNQKEVFEEPDLLEGLQLCKSQFDLVETFPVVGLSLKIKRFDGSMVNPWKIKVEELGKVHKVIDSMYLANNNNKYELTVGDGKTESINAVLPLFSLEDGEMSQLLNSRLFRLAISFMAVQNIDTYHDEAYLALLGETLVYLLKKPNSQWRNELMDSIYTSLKVTYGATEQFKALVARVVDDPFVLFTAKEQEDHVDITKVMLIVFYIGKEQLVSLEILSHLVDLVLVHYTEKTYVQNEFKLSKVVSIRVGGELQIKKEWKELERNQIKDLKQLGERTMAEVKEWLKMDKLQIDLEDKIFVHIDEERRVTFPHIQAYYLLLTGKELEKGEILFHFGHYLKGKNAANYQSPVQRNQELLNKIALHSLDLDTFLNPKTNAKVAEMRELVSAKYYNIFKKTHFGILPLSENKLMELAVERGISRQKLELSASGMIMNACMSPSCVHFLRPMKKEELTDHMRLWRKKLPTRFHSFVTSNLRKGTKTDNIHAMLLSLGIVNLERHETTTEELLQYIREIEKSLA